MTQKEAAQVLAILKAAYPQFYKDMTKTQALGTVNVWAMQFAEVPVDIVLIAINKLIATNQFPPSPSEVHKKLSSVHWEAYEVLREQSVHRSLTDEQVKYYKYIKEKTEYCKYTAAEPSIAVIKSHYAMIDGSENQMLLGGGEDA